MLQISGEKMITLKEAYQKVLSSGELDDNEKIIEIWDYKDFWAFETNMYKLCPPTAIVKKTGELTWFFFLDYIEKPHKVLPLSALEE